MSKKKCFKGLKNVHFAKWNGTGYEKPVPIQYAKKIENTLNYETESDWADDEIVCVENGFSGGEGTLTTLGLTAEEQTLIFGSKKVPGGLVVKSEDMAPTGAFLFERKMKEEKGKRLYVVYACKCAPASFGGETIEEGKGASEESEISYSISENSEHGIFYFIDTNVADVPQDQIENWYKEVQFPTEASAGTSGRSKKTEKGE